MDADLHPVTVLGVADGQEASAPLLTLEDDLGRRLVMPIGMCEAIGIRMALDGTTIGRPLTHDVIADLLVQLEAPPARVVIDDLSKGVYFARLILKGPDGPITLDCRPSDGVAIALRTNAPILATDAVMLGEGEE
jgi:uncharacterized protein